MNKATLDAIRIWSFWLCALLLGACSNGVGGISAKWQLQSQEADDGTATPVGNVFYNFQKGSFSAICLLKDGSYETFFGNYSLSGGEISIILLPESVDSPNYAACMGWEGAERTFAIVELSDDVLRLKHGEVTYHFRRY